MANGLREKQRVYVLNCGATIGFCGVYAERSRSIALLCVLFATQPKKKWLICEMRQFKKRNEQVMKMNKLKKCLVSDYTEIQLLCAIKTLMLPFSIKQKRIVNSYDPGQAARFFNLTAEQLKQLKVDHIVNTDNHLSFRNSFFNGQSNWNLMAMVDSGYFTYDCQTKTLIYSYSIKRAFVIVVVLSVIVGSIAASLAAAIGCFLWFYGMNLLILVVRQSRFFDTLVQKAENSRTAHNISFKK